MKKDSLICFRASVDLRESLLKVAKEDQRSLSSTIEIALTNYLKERKAFHSVKKERRQYPRKIVSLPAFINQYDSGEASLYAASVTNLSLGGLRISVPGDIKFETLIDPQTSKFQIVFTLPNENRPIILKCESRDVAELKDGVHVGASFVDADFSSYKALQSYLM
jgi:hypothetical protein